MEERACLEAQVREEQQVDNLKIVNSFKNKLRTKNAKTKNSSDSGNNKIVIEHKINKKKIVTSFRCRIGNNKWKWEKASTCWATRATDLKKYIKENKLKGSMWLQPNIAGANEMVAVYGMRKSGKKREYDIAFDNGHREWVGQELVMTDGKELLDDYHDAEQH
jgi:hypothetical protein